LEPQLDHGHPAAAMKALAAADTVVALTAFASPDLLEVADCLLPVTPFTETAGSFVNCAGTSQSFNAVVRPAGEARPAWKVLRVLGNLLELPGFDQETAEQVRAQALPADLSGQLSQGLRGAPASVPAPGSASTLERIADVPVYFSDPIVRRASSLQQTTDAAAPDVRLNAVTLARLGLTPGDSVRVVQEGAGGSGMCTLSVILDEGVADNVVRLAAAHVSTAALGAMIGPISLERVQ
jgi:NADH-quinone oxidoreductase subunit G